MMKTIIFCKKGEAVSDFYISQYVDEIFTLPKRIWRTSTALVIDEIRARVKEKKVSLDSFHIKVENLQGNISNFKIDKDGRSPDWVDSMDVSMNISTRIL